MQPEQTVDLAIEALMAGTADYAVIPQENTVGGAVTNYVDALLNQTDVCVVGEVILPISQTLMGVPGASLSDVKIICSHAQGIAQSERWRKQNLPNAEVKEMSSTAAAAEYVAKQQDKTIAAVAAPGAAPLYGLEVLARNVQITDANKTRFYVLSRSGSFVSGSRAVFAAVCDADRIDDVIVEIHNSGLELVTIHDRPEGSKLGRYRYIIEVTAESGVSDEQIAKIEKAEDVRCLGRFDSVEKTN
jgi:Prephenate dehydratase